MAPPPSPYYITHHSPSDVINFPRLLPMLIIITMMPMAFFPPIKAAI